MTRKLSRDLSNRIRNVIGCALKDLYPGIEMLTFIWLGQKIMQFLLDCCEDEFLKECEYEEEPVAFDACFNREAVISYLNDNKGWIYEQAPALKDLEDFDGKKRINLMVGQMLLAK